jgi:hypothetical protein
MGDVTATVYGNRFSVAVSTATISGKFDSDTTSSGEIKAKISSPQCGECNSTATWNAKKL